MSIILSNLNRFTTFFHWKIPWKSCSELQGGPKKLYIFQHAMSLEPFTKIFLEFLAIKIRLQFFMQLLIILCKLDQCYYTKNDNFRWF